MEKGRDGRKRMSLNYSFLPFNLPPPHLQNRKNVNLRTFALRHL